MRKWIFVVTLLAIPAFAQRGGGDNRNVFRRDLAAAVQNGALTPDEKQKYEAALATLDQQKAARQSGEAKVDVRAVRQAMRDLATIARSSNLTEEDRARLAKYAEGRGRRGKRKSTEL